MTNDFRPDPAAVGLPSLLAQGVASLARSGLNIAAGALVAAGVLTDDTSAQFVNVGLAVALWGAGYVWSLVRNRGTHKAVKTALVTPLPDPNWVGTPNSRR